MFDSCYALQHNNCLVPYKALVTQLHDNAALLLLLEQSCTMPALMQDSSA